MNTTGAVKALAVSRVWSPVADALSTKPTALGARGMTSEVVGARSAVAVTVRALPGCVQLTVTRKRFSSCVPS